MKQMKKGFTLIELMIVVAIIGVLAAVAIPKFADLIRKAQEAACKGQLGAMRSALSIYYGNEEGSWPQVSQGTDTLLAGCIAPTYVQEIPNAKPGQGMDSNSITGEQTGSTDLPGTPDGWWFNSGGSNGTGVNAGSFKVNTYDTDTKTSAIHSW